MKALAILGCCLLAAGLMLSCGQQATQEAPAIETETATTPETAAPPVPAMVEVSAEGTVFDPPVSVDQIPVGAWYCDMGTVHYASLEKGEGRCAECGMELVQKQASAVADEGDQADDAGESSEEDHG